MQESYQEQYYKICNQIIDNPYKIVESRIGDVRSRFGHQIRVNLTDEFPLMDLKKIKFSNVLHELLWFVKGDTNIKYLKENKCGIWDDDCFRYYNEKFIPMGFPQMSKDEFIDSILEDRKYGFFSKEKNKYLSYHFGDLEKIYGYQWRHFNGKTDQLTNCINTLKRNPDDRRMIVTAHNPTDIEEGNVGLPSCHSFFSFYSFPIDEETKKEMRKCGDNRERYLCVNLFQRSADIFLGVPYNAPSYSILLMMIAKLVNMVPYEVILNFSDTHIYESHMNAVKIWSERFKNVVKNDDGESELDDTYCKSTLTINGNQKTIDDFKFEDFVLCNYNPQPYIKAELLT